MRRYGIALTLTALAAFVAAGHGHVAAATGARLTAITATDGAAPAVLIEASEPVAYRTTRPDPFTVLVDLRNVATSGYANGFTARPDSPVRSVARRNRARRRRPPGGPCARLAGRADQPPRAQSAQPDLRGAVRRRRRRGASPRQPPARGSRRRRLRRPPRRWPSAPARALQQVQHERRRRRDQHHPGGQRPPRARRTSSALAPGVSIWTSRASRPKRRRSPWSTRARSSACASPSTARSPW